MKHTVIHFTALLLAPIAAMPAPETKTARPNVLFIIADDASSHFGGAYGCTWVRTPHIDRLVKQGLVFDHAYTPTSKCAPSRAAILTGRSFTDLLRGQAEGERGFVLLGRERNDVLARPGSAAGLGYPTRAIREGDFFYVRNFAPERWPCGNSELELKDTDANPSKTFVAARGEQGPFWQLAYDKRPAEQLFDLSSDPDCVTNLAGHPAFAAKAAALRDKLMAELRRQEDPRALGHGDVFDQYLSPRVGSTDQGPKRTAKKKAQPLLFR